MNANGGLQLGTHCINGGWFSIVVLNYQTDPNVISSGNGSLVVWGVKPMSNLRSENHEPICKVFYKVSMTAAQPVLYFSF
jgi:hypothetical protein